MAKLDGAPKVGSRPSQPRISLHRPMDFPLRSLPTGVSTRMRRRVLPLICIAIVVVIVFLCRNEFDFGSRSTLTQGQGVDPHLLENDLGLSIVHVNHDPPIIRATVTNYHPETSVMLLTSGTPLEDNALHAGLFSIIDLTTREVLLTPRTTTSDQRIISEAEIQEILPRHAITKDIKLDLPALSKNHKFEVYLQGNWSAVWIANVKVHGAEKLKKMGGGFGMWRHSYKSEHIDFEYT